jgi:hypothetical protein
VLDKTLAYVAADLFVVATLALPALILWTALAWNRRKRQRSPLTKNLLRGPGETLLKELDSAHTDIAGYYFATVFFPPLIVLLKAMPTIVAGAPAPKFDPLFVALLVLSESYLLWKLLRLVGRAKAIRLGLDGEVAVGQELNQLMLQGFRVYHDLQADGFNIDHVVVGPRGVFAVETKARAKPPKGNGRAAVEVRFDGKQLIFPDYAGCEAIDQAERQAKWLHTWLTSAVGEHVPVYPLVIIPGWFVRLEAPVRDIHVLSSGQIEKCFRGFGQARLEPSQIQRIAHQLDQRCRNIEPWSPNQPRGDKSQQQVFRAR